MSISTLKLQIIVPCLRVDTLQEFHIFLETHGLFEVQSKNIGTCSKSFYLIFLKTGLFNYIFLPLLTFLNHCLICMFNHMNLFFISKCISQRILICIFLTKIHERTAQYFFALTPHSQYQSTEFSPLFQSILLKPNSTWFLANEIALLQKYSKFFQFALKKNNFCRFCLAKHAMFLKKLGINSIAIH